MNSTKLISELIGSKISDIRRVCDLIMFTFVTQEKREIFVHTQCLLRFFVADKLILTTESLYYPGEKYKKKLFKKFDWTVPGTNLFDDLIKTIKEELISTSVKDVIQNNKDIRIVFGRKIKLDILELVTKSDDDSFHENYRIFDNDKDKDHYVM